MLLHRVRQTIDHYHLLDPGDRVIVGVSAGVDSMVLLHLLHACRDAFDLSLIVAHVNHGLRPQESEKEADLVQKECERLGLPFESAAFDTKGFQRLRRCSLQEAARRLRFHFLEQVLQKYGAHKIALGHHADDQIETVLLRLMRGGGLQGLKGILPMREGKVIRPLLEVWRNEIETFALENQIPFLLDSSNLKEGYLRNRIRLSLLPLLEREYQPSLKKILLRTSAILREENDYLEKETDRLYKSVVEEGEGIIRFQHPTYQALHPAIQWRLLLRMLKRILGGERGDVEASRVFKMLKQPPPSFLWEFSFGVCMEKRYETVSLRQGKAENTPPFEVTLVTPGRTLVKEIGREVVTEEMDGKDRPERVSVSSETALLDCHALEFPLRIRNFRPGDRFEPLGVKGSQKLKEFFIDHKIPRFERPRVPLLISGEKIVWVIGHRISEWARISEKTEKILKVTVI